MSYKIINFDIPYHTAGKNREFCIEYNNIYIINKQGDDCIIDAFHNGKKVIGGIDKHHQMIGNRSIIYDSNVTNTNESYDVYESDPSFLLYDAAGLNYIHFFFCFFGKCYYYDELTKDNKIKLYIPEQLYRDTGKSNFIKQWLSLYYEKIEVNILKTNIRYKFNSLILPNAFYNFPQPYGYDAIYPMIRKVTDKIPVDESLKNKGVYISRQDTIKRGWYHNRVLENELELIEKIKNKLNYDIIELMDYDMADKIKLFKSYKTIVQQSSASVIGILFSNKTTNHIILEHPKMNWWLTPKCKEFSNLTKSTLVTVEGFGELVQSEKQVDDNNYPWKLIELDYLIDNIASVS